MEHEPTIAELMKKLLELSEYVMRGMPKVTKRLAAVEESVTDLGQRFAEMELDVRIIKTVVLEHSVRLQELAA